MTSISNRSFFLVNFTLKKQHLLRAPTMALFSSIFYGRVPYPLIKSFFIRDCQTIMFYLFHIPFVSDLKWNHIWGNSKRCDGSCSSTERLFSSSMKGPCITNGNLNFPKHRQLRKQLFEHEKASELHFDVK